MWSFEVEGSPDEFAAQGAQSLVGLARDNFGVELDLGLDSLQVLDTEVLEKFHLLLKLGKVDEPSEYALVAGLYVGETIRKSAPFHWVNENSDLNVGTIESFYLKSEGALSIQANVCHWCLKRIVSGSEEAIPDKVQALMHVLAEGSIQEGEKTPPGGIFLKMKKLFGK